MRPERNNDGTVLPEHVTDEGIELRTVEERIDHEEAKRIARRVDFGFDETGMPIAHAELKDLAREEVIRHVLRHGEVGKQSERILRSALLPATEPAQPEEPRG